MADLSLITPTEFDYDHLTNVKDARFTVFDVMHLFSSGTSSDQHMYVRGLVEQEFDGDSDFPASVGVERVFGNNAKRVVQSYLLTHTQVMQLMSRATGAQGKINRRKVRRYIEALEARVQTQAASIARAEAQRNAAIELHNKYMVKLSDDIDTLRDTVYSTQTVTTRKKCRDQVDSLRGYLSWVRSTTAMTHGITAKPRSIDPVATV